MGGDNGARNETKLCPAISLTEIGLMRSCDSREADYCVAGVPVIPQTYLFMKVEKSRSRHVRLLAAVSMDCFTLYMNI
jgi:hypothetical protein